MKKATKFLALLLVLAMTVGLMGVGAAAADTAAADPTAAGAASDGAPPDGGAGGPGGPGGGATATVTAATTLSQFSDLSSIANQDAVSMLMGMGIINGYTNADGTHSFLPTNNVKRSEMAKMVAIAATAAKGTIGSETTTPFTDVASGHWASAYINYCKTNSIIDGSGNSKYNPDGSVTGVETAKLLLAAMGVSGLTGDSWAEKTKSEAEKLNLFDGVTNIDTALTRDEAARLISNALLASDGTATLPKVIYVKETTSEDSLTLTDNTVIAAPAGKLVSLVVGGKDVAIAAGTYTSAKLVVTDSLGSIGSFSGGGTTAADNDYAYRTGLYVDSTGVVASKSVQDAVSGGTVTSTKADGITIDSADAGFNGIVVNSANYEISNANINFASASDGSKVCDFSGLGAAIAVFGKGSKVTISNSTIKTTGVAKLAAFSDNTADVIIKNSTLDAEGGTLYSDYVNSPNQATMVAPPWVLGIMGNARTTNLMGTDSSMTVLDSTTSAAQWGVLSTDSGSNMKLNVFNTTLTLNGAKAALQAKNSDGTTYYSTTNPYCTKYGSGYGTYVIGGADELFRGATLNVGTYGSIFTGGTATYSSLVKGTSYDLKNASGASLGTYVSTDNKLTTVNSDTFGFMAHQGENTMNIEAGTVVNSGKTSILLKDVQGTTTMNLSGGAQLNPGNGILVQMMDNDDSRVGMIDMASGFKREFNEAAGWPSDTKSVTGKSSGVTDVLNAKDVALKGNIYNGTGYYDQSAVALTVNLGSGATLNGAIASTEAIHVNEKYDTSMTDAEALACQNTHFTISEYYYLGQVANRVYNNGSNTIAVNLSDGATWTVTGTSLISSLTVGTGCTVKGTLTVDGTATKIEAGKTYTGKLELSPAA